MRQQNEKQRSRKTFEFQITENDTVNLEIELGKVYYIFLKLLLNDYVKFNPTLTMLYIVLQLFSRIQKTSEKRSRKILMKSFK